MKTYNGMLSLHKHGYDEEVLFLSSLKEPFAKELEYLCGKQVSVRYWITSEKQTKDEVNENFVKQIMGMADVEFEPVYSDITGYLWTNEDLYIGGHDLISELKSHIGKWLILEIDIV